jgi:membrane associated rhomboid family serine protease
MTCNNCNAEISSKFCPECGQPATLKRIDGHYIIHEIEHVLHFERGILYTIKELLINPGQNIRNYLTSNRSRLVKPIIFIIITSLIYTIAVKLFHIDDNFIKLDDESGKLHTPQKLFEWVASHYGYSNIIIGVFIAFFIKLFFRKSNYNFFEILIMLCFVTGVAMLIYSFFALLQGIIAIKTKAIGGIIGSLYCAWAIGIFLKREKYLIT